MGSKRFIEIDAGGSRWMINASNVVSVSEQRPGITWRDTEATAGAHVTLDTGESLFFEGANVYDAICAELMLR